MADVEALLKSIAKFVPTSGQKVLVSHEESAQLLIAWIANIRASQLTGTADVLVDGLHASLIETAGCLSIGMVRPAIFSIRAQVDILFAWMFFKDHLIEWQHVEHTGENYRLPGEVIKYLRVYFKRFDDRLKSLRKARRHGPDDPYSLLSAHVHGQNSVTIPPLVKLEALIQPSTRCQECVQLQSDISEYLSDVLLACFASQWMDLPDIVRTDAEERIGKAKLKDFCT